MSEHEAAGWPASAGSSSREQLLEGQTDAGGPGLSVVPADIEPGDATGPAAAGLAGQHPAGIQEPAELDVERGVADSTLEAAPGSAGGALAGQPASSPGGETSSELADTTLSEADIEPGTSSELAGELAGRPAGADIDQALAGQQPGSAGDAPDSSAGEPGDSADPAPDSGYVGPDPQAPSPDGDSEAVEDELEPRIGDDEETLRRKFDLAGGRRFHPRTGKQLSYDEWRATWRSGLQVRHDWAAIRARYVEGYTGPDGAHVWPSLNTVAEHFNAGVTSVHKRSSAEGWAAARGAWQAEVEAERRKARVAELAQAGDKIDSRALNAAELGIQLCVTRLVEIGRAVEVRRQTSGSIDYGSAVDPREMQALAAATDLWHKIGLRAVGDREALRVQLVGANGSALDIGNELTRDNPERLSGVVAVLEAAGLGEFFRQAEEDLDSEAGVVDGELVE